MANSNNFTSRAIRVSYLRESFFDGIRKPRLSTLGSVFFKAG